jgi:predicted kinase
MKPKYVAFVGIPGSGKSTMAKRLVKSWNGPTVVVCRDTIREELFGPDYKFTKAREAAVTGRKVEMIVSAVADGHNIIVDETHCTEKARVSTKNLFKDLGKEVEFIPLIMSFDVDKCHKNNVDRDAVVPFTVLERMFEGFLEFAKTDPIGTWVPDNYKKVAGRQSCIIVDVDGTLADHKGIRSPFDWGSVGQDRPKQEVINMIRMLADDHRVIVFSGRDGSCYNETQKWLVANGVPFDELHLREAGSMEKDYLVKMRMYRNHIEGKYNVAAVFDDRAQVCRYWAALGLPLFQIGFNNFF